jgi:hypothetical protein
METAIIPFECESDAGAFLPAETGGEEPPKALKDGDHRYVALLKGSAIFTFIHANTSVGVGAGDRPRRERKAPDMEEFDVTTVSRARKQLKTPPVLDADAEDFLTFLSRAQNKSKMSCKLPTPTSRLLLLILMLQSASLCLERALKSA